MIASASSLPRLEELTAAYQNTAEHNDALFARLTQFTWADALLKEHRLHMENHALGFGDAAFHSMWAILLRAATARFRTINALEIGVYKGQVISLWALLARELCLQLKIDAITPLTGKPLPRKTLLRRIRYNLSSRFREQIAVGNFYTDINYAGVIGDVFKHFDLDVGDVTFYRGYSTDPDILKQLQHKCYHVVYVDGDHSYEGAMHDFLNFGPKVALGGWLVADDASFDLPGNSFWKGYKPVARACSTLPALGFKNVLNVGHNRIFERVM